MESCQNKDFDLTSERRGMQPRDNIQGVEEKLCFFQIHYNPSLANIAPRDLKSFQLNASEKSIIGCPFSELGSWEFIKEERNIFKTCFYSWSKSCFLSFFLGQERVFFLFSWSRSCFHSFFLES